MSLASLASNSSSRRAKDARGDGRSDVADEARRPATRGLEQVVENLVDNALKYGRPGGTVGYAESAERASW